MQRLGAGMIPIRPRQHRRQPIQASSMAAPRNMAKPLLPLPPRLCLPMAVRAHLLQTRGAGLLLFTASDSHSRFSFSQAAALSWPVHEVTRLVLEWGTISTGEEGGGAGCMDGPQRMCTC